MANVEDLERRVAVLEGQLKQFEEHFTGEKMELLMRSIASLETVSADTKALTEKLEPIFKFIQAESQNRAARRR